MDATFWAVAKRRSSTRSRIRKCSLAVAHDHILWSFARWNMDVIAGITPDSKMCSGLPPLGGNHLHIYRRFLYLRSQRFAYLPKAELIGGRELALKRCRRPIGIRGADDAPAERYKVFRIERIERRLKRGHGLSKGDKDGLTPSDIEEELAMTEGAVVKLTGRKCARTAKGNSTGFLDAKRGPETRTPRLIRAIFV